MDPNALEIAQIDHQIAALELRKAQLQGQAPPDWPQEVAFMLHADRAALRRFGLKLGLGRDALDVFTFSCDAVPVTMLIDATGYGCPLTAWGKRLIGREEGRRYDGE